MPDSSTHVMLRLPAVIKRVGLSRSAIYERIANGSFPKPVKLAGGKAVAWPEKVINDLLDSWIARSAPQAVAA